VRHTLSAHSKEVTSVVSPQGSTLPVGDRDNQLWNPDTGEFHSLGSSTSGYVQFQP